MPFHATSLKPEQIGCSFFGHGTPQVESLATTDCLEQALIKPKRLKKLQPGLAIAKTRARFQRLAKLASVWAEIKLWLKRFCIQLGVVYGYKVWERENAYVKHEAWNCDFGWPRTVYICQLSTDLSTSWLPQRSQMEPRCSQNWIVQQFNPHNEQHRRCDLGLQKISCGGDRERERERDGEREREKEREKEYRRVWALGTAWHLLALASFPQFDHPWVHPGGVGLVCLMRF